MLIRSQPERPLVDFCDLFHARLEVFAWFILDTSVLNEECKMVFAVLACYPTKIINIAIKSVGTGRLKGVAKQFLYFGFEDVEAHSVYGVLQTCILSADEAWVSAGAGNNYQESGLLTLRDCHCLVEPT
jgi:hypothetical protein